MTDAASRIRAARAAAGLTQAEAATRAGMARTNWLRLEQRTHDPRLSTLRRVRDALGCSWEALLGE